MIQKLDKESRLKLLKQAPPEIQELYSSEENGTVLSETAKRLGILGEDAYDTFALTVGDIILGVHQKELLGQMLKDRMELSDEHVRIAEDGLREFLAKVPSRKTAEEPVVLPMSPELTYSTDKLPTTATTNPPSASEIPVQNITELAVKPLRTFADDVGLSRAHGYGAFRSNENQDTGVADDTVHRSSQDDIIGK